MFGPVISLIEFDSEEDAIDLANDSEYGLGSGLFTKDLSRAHRVSKEIKAGICWINTYKKYKLLLLDDTKGNLAMLRSR